MLLGGGVGLLIVTSIIPTRQLLSPMVAPAQLSGSYPQLPSQSSSILLVPQFSAGAATNWQVPELHLSPVFPGWQLFPSHVSGGLDTIASPQVTLVVQVFHAHAASQDCVPLYPPAVVHDCVAPALQAAVHTPAWQAKLVQDIDE